MEFYIYQTEGVGSSTSTWTKVGTVTDADTYTVTNLVPKTEYSFAVSAFNGSRESAKSNIVTLTTSGIATTAVTIKIDKPSLEVGGTATASVTITPSNETDGSAVYSSDNTKVAAVNASSGLVTAVGAGTANIIAKVGDVTSAKIAVTVYEALVSIATLTDSAITATGATLTWTTN